MDFRFRSLIDRFGATGSVICAVHCALTPLLLAAIPSLGLSAWLGDGFERGFVLFVTVLGLFSLLWGYRRHRAFRALSMLLVGLAVLWAGAYYPPLHHQVVV
ncbi:MAG TPA: MerC domain-containing protein, partial [Pseudoxanthomonas sp.]